MATVTLKVQLAGPTDISGTCRVMFEVTNADGIDPAIFVIKWFPPEYQGAESIQLWQHVAYVDELSELPTSPNTTTRPCFIRKAAVTVEYASLKLADEAIKSIRSQIQRLVNDLNVLSVYSEPTTWIISSTN
jgi:hypothetical protein